MHLFASLAALCLLTPVAMADDNVPAKKIVIPDAASLIGKTISGDRQGDIGSNAKKAKSDDWEYGFEYDDAGLQRSAESTQRGKGGALLSTVFAYDKRCAPSEKAASFSFGAGDAFKLKGSQTKGRYADAWITPGDKDSFDAKSLKVKMDFSENDAAMYFVLDPSSLTTRGVLAICPTAAPPAGATGHCAIFSLKGFARAYDYVCNAK
jgi:hypothetical protein